MYTGQVEYYCDTESDGYQLDQCQSARAYLEIAQEDNTGYIVDEIFWQQQLRYDQEAANEDCTAD